MGPPIHMGNARTARNAAIVPRHGRLGLLWCARDSSCRHPWRLQRARIALLRVLGDPSGQHETRGRGSPGHSALDPARAALASPRGGCLPRIEPRHGLAGKSTYVPVLGRLLSHEQTTMATMAPRAAARSSEAMRGGPVRLKGSAARLDAHLRRRPRLTCPRRLWFACCLAR